MILIVDLPDNANTAGRASLTDGDRVFAHEAGARQELVHEVAVLELALIVGEVGDAVPRLDAEEGRMLAPGRPYGYGRCLEVDRHIGLVLLVEQRDVVDL